MERRAESFAQLIVSEAGKTITQARKEVARAVNTLSLSAAEAWRNAGEVIPFDSYEGSEKRQGWFTREPLGIIAAITPFILGGSPPTRSATLLTSVRRR
ncbi:aldehyde dehydrogenase family protein [Nonomuraea sp. NBC_00507]|uniref:aldehyde dehydrogenase family protein n=1 Tax=Nonomuraea sp. NBC_00507 TaxID=2976002 RepID=UPI003FA5D098